MAVVGAAALVLLTVSVSGLHRFARSRTSQLFGRLVPRVDTDERVVALTFDDGPTAAAADEVLSVLASRGVRATFFVNGAHLSEVPEVARRLVAGGHELGNHSYSHARLVLRTPGFIRSEVERTDDLIRAAGQKGDILFRPPFCWKLVLLPWYLARRNRTTITWDVDGDSGSLAQGPEEITEKCVRAVHPGSIILLHVWYRTRGPSRAALPKIIDRLRANGYRFVTVRELLRYR